MTKYEKAASALNDLQPELFINFVVKKKTLIGAVLNKSVDKISYIVFNAEKVAMLARAYDLTLGVKICPYGSSSVETLTTKSHYNLLNKKSL